MEWVVKRRNGESEEWPRVSEVVEWEWPNVRPEAVNEWGKVRGDRERNSEWPKRHSAEIAEWGKHIDPDSWLPPRPGQTDRQAELDWLAVSRPESSSQPVSQRWPQIRHTTAPVCSLRVGECVSQPRLAHAGACRCARPPPPAFLRAPACRHVCRHQCHLPPACVRCNVALCRQPAIVSGWPRAPQPRMPAPQPPAYRQVTPM